jgi:lipid-A-disaccharide synthase-like uncharacterized protein
MLHWDTAGFWLAIGFLGQALFFMRFFVQWLASEKEGRSIIPTAFWYFSIAGGVTLFAYAIWRRDPVFIIGQGSGLFIYLRNIYLLVREKRAQAKRLQGQQVGDRGTYSI